VAFEQQLGLHLMGDLGVGLQTFDLAQLALQQGAEVGEVRGELTIDAIIDKGAEKGALLYSTRRVYGTGDNLLASVRQVSSREATTPSQAPMRGSS